MAQLCFIQTFMKDAILRDRTAFQLLSVKKEKKNMDYCLEGSFSAAI